MQPSRWRRLAAVTAAVASGAPSDSASGGDATDAAQAKEEALRAEAASWAGVSSRLSELAVATPAEIPTIDLGPFHDAGCVPGPALDRAAAALRSACENTGFHYIVNHGVSEPEIASGFAIAEQYHSGLSVAAKFKHEMDTTDGQPGGAGCKRTPASQRVHAPYLQSPHCSWAPPSCKVLKLSAIPSILPTHRRSWVFSDLPLSNWKLPRPEKVCHPAPIGSPTLAAVPRGTSTCVATCLLLGCIARRRPTVWRLTW